MRKPDLDRHFGSAGIDGLVLDVCRFGDRIHAVTHDLIEVAACFARA